MGYTEAAKTSGRRPITLVELLLDRCTQEYGVSPCQAAIGVTGETYCFKTFGTCQYKSAYTAEPYAYRYIEPRSDAPPSLRAISSVKAVNLAPTKMEVAGGLGARASVQVTFQDHKHHDRDLDPYWRERYSGAAGTDALTLASSATDTLVVNGSGDHLVVNRPTSALAGMVVSPDGTGLPGTYWGRLRARNPHYVGRVCLIKTGYLDLDEADWSVRTYLLESMIGPDSNGMVAIKAKDPLKLADNERAQAPRPGTGALTLAINRDETTISVTPEAALDEFDDSGYLRIGEEIMIYTKVGVNLEVLRGQFGTDAEEHDSNDTVQPCLRIAGQTVSQILELLFGTYAEIPAEYMPIAQWEAEQDQYLPNVYSTLIAEPTSVATLVKELCQSGPFSVWWDEREALIKIRALRQPQSSDILDEEEDLIADSVTVTDKPDMRVSQQWVFLNQRNPTEQLEKASNWKQLIVNADLDAETDNAFGTAAISKLYSRWINTRSVGVNLAAITVQRFGDVPREVKFALDAVRAQDYWTGDIARISTRQIQTDLGENAVIAVQITQANETQPGQRVDYTAMAFSAVAYTPSDDIIVISESTFDVDLYDLYVERRGTAPTGSTDITFVVETNVTIGQIDGEGAVETGLWPSGAKILLENNGRIQGYGGHGGDDRKEFGANGQDGGNALVCQDNIRVANYGEIWGGGGGGGACGVQGTLVAGGGGAGSPPGLGGLGEKNFHGEDGTTTEGGDGGDPEKRQTDGGDPGQPGEKNNQSNVRNYENGEAGYYVVNNDLVTWLVVGDVRGRSI